MIKPTFLLFLALFLASNGLACRETPKRSIPSLVNVMIHDRTCKDVNDRLIKELKNQNLSFDWTDKERGFLSVGPAITSPLSSDSFVKMEETYRLEIKCIDPISTRISVRIQLKGLTSENRWVEIKDTDKLTAYGKRFLDSLINQ